MTAVDPPDRLKWSDKMLDWLSDYRRRWEKRLAAESTERADTEWIARYIAAQACTLENAPISERRKVIAEIQAVMTEAGLWWSPEELKGE